MTPTKLLIGQVLIVFAIVMLGLWAATQWAASMLGYQPQLGLPWFSLGELPVYRPWALFGWWYHYEAYAPEVFDRAGTLAGASGFLGCAAAVFGSLWRARQCANVTTYGSARWASEREVRRAGLFRDHGVFLGKLGGHYLRHDGPEHVMAFAPTRSGKGVGLVVPTLLSWTGSAIVHDIKGENWRLTAGWRSLFSHCLLFDPTNVRSACYNPLLEVRRGAHARVRTGQCGPGRPADGRAQPRHPADHPRAARLPLARDSPQGPRASAVERMNGRASPRQAAGPHRIAISVMPELNQALADYADLYRETYGQAAPVQELIPAMLAKFLEGDRAFARRRGRQG